MLARTDRTHTKIMASTFPENTHSQNFHPTLVRPIGPANTVMKVISHSPKAVAAPPICRYSRGAISEQYSHTHPCHAYPNTNRKMNIIPIDTHCIEAFGCTACSTVKMRINTDITIAPYISTDRRPMRSIVKYNGTQPSAKNILRIPERSETKDGRAPTPARITLPIVA